MKNVVVKGLKVLLKISLGLLVVMGLFGLYIGIRSPDNGLSLFIAAMSIVGATYLKFGKKGFFVGAGAVICFSFFIPPPIYSMSDIEGYKRSDYRQFNKKTFDQITKVIVTSSDKFNDDDLEFYEKCFYQSGVYMERSSADSFAEIASICKGLNDNPSEHNKTIVDLSDFDRDYISYTRSVGRHDYLLRDKAYGRALKYKALNNKVYFYYSKDGRPTVTSSIEYVLDNQADHKERRTSLADLDLGTLELTVLNDRRS
ncbi:hypothetical protein EDB29_1011119 [Vibrio crassostreae]|uniref:hypothetical protein n=1 Tax=Vibrio crassostreae TaxID=246167 RepID=UPI00104F204C|nr:hypothetical protein [Vibrio crassostreae]CAH6850839.1 membrane hypothetical protein [Vibrio chagasii]TCT44307.1 hypothetical protein EDB29_1011119 [Vibrio crassostreae]CAH6862353.1 membrane hypothetical protein [Vibrio chagasii]CAH6926802.1 membrane hypothetical protein [Vibrio chagasii]CAH6946082.1 membrane hypothetical protein [Vibrio chagasii]